MCAPNRGGYVMAPEITVWMATVYYALHVFIVHFIMVTPLSASGRLMWVCVHGYTNPH